MGLLDNLAGTVGNLLTKFGTDSTWRTYTESYDPATGTNTLTATDATISAMWEDYPARDTKGGTTNTDGIVRGDKRVTAAANAFAVAPTVEGKWVRGGVQWSVVKIDEQMGTDSALLYTFQVRK
jgi:hypothetical protein